METDISLLSSCLQIRWKHFQTAKCNLQKAKNFAKHDHFYSNFSLVQSWLLALSHLSLHTWLHTDIFYFSNIWTLDFYWSYSPFKSPQVWLFLSIQLLFWMSAVSLTYKTSKIFLAQDKDQIWFSRSTFVNTLFHLTFLKVQEKLMHWEHSLSVIFWLSFHLLLKSDFYSGSTKTLNWKRLLNALETSMKKRNLV